ncbi:hypothetical protein I315_01912 [Cryptococcus gattii Ru294]|nr:hypothetical protein I315_01912 [Cryptococcus gattii Ru294]
MSAAIEDLSSFFFSTGIVAPDGAVAPSDLFFIPTQLQSTEFNTQPWSISNNELPATEPQAEFSLGQDALAGDDDDFVSYFANLFGNENDADSVGQIGTQQGDWQPSVNNRNIHTEEPHELFGQKRIDEFIGWDFNISVPDANIPPIAPALVPVTPATQAYLTILSKPSIPETPKDPSKPRRTSSSPKAPRISKSPSKKGSLKDALFGPRVVSSSGPKTRGAISCLACRDRKKPVSYPNVFHLRIQTHLYLLLVRRCISIQMRKMHQSRILLPMGRERPRGQAGPQTEGRIHPIHRGPRGTAWTARRDENDSGPHEGAKTASRLPTRLVLFLFDVFWSWPFHFICVLKSGITGFSDARRHRHGSNQLNSKSGIF